MSKEPRAKSREVGPGPKEIAERQGVERLILAHQRELQEWGADATTTFCTRFNVSPALYYWASRCLPRQIALELGEP